MTGKTTSASPEFVIFATNCLLQLVAVAVARWKFKLASQNSHNAFLVRRLRAAWLFSGLYYISIFLGVLVEFGSDRIGIPPEVLGPVHTATSVLATMVSLWFSFLLFTATAIVAGLGDIVPLGRPAALFALLGLSGTLVGLAFAFTAADYLIIVIDHLSSFAVLTWLAITLWRRPVPKGLGKNHYSWELIRHIGVLLVGIWAVAQLGRFLLEYRTDAVPLCAVVIELSTLLLIQLLSALTLAIVSQWPVKKAC